MSLRGLRGMRQGAVFCLILLGLVLVQAIGCVSPGNRGVSSPVAPTSIAATSSPNAKLLSDATALGTALESALQRPTYFNEEPRGDLGAYDAGSPGVFARVTGVSTSGAVEVSFDVEQFYQGRYAPSEAAKDGIKQLEGDYYIRNRYRHVQKLPLAADAAILLISSEDSTNTYAQFPSPGMTHELGTAAALARRFPPKAQVDSREVWLETDEGKIVLIIEQFFP
jgi:hypothetical protein